MAEVKRSDVEPLYEEMLVGLARELVPETIDASTPEAALRKASDFFPGWFGGVFPQAGIAITRSIGENAARDKRHLPEAVAGELRIYYPSFPLKGANSPQEDLGGKAKRITREVRSGILDRIMESKIGPFVAVLESAGGDRNAAGIAQATEPVPGRTPYIVWVDRTIFEITVSL